jgi:hypothetical protein
VFVLHHVPGTNLITIANPSLLSVVETSGHQHVKWRLSIFRHQIRQARVASVAMTPAAAAPRCMIDEKRARKAFSALG